jgi:hypothetical protein
MAAIRIGLIRSVTGAERFTETLKPCHGRFAGNSGGDAEI